MILIQITAEFSQQEMMKIGCDDAFLETLLWAIENCHTVHVCLHFLQVLRIIFHVKGTFWRTYIFKEQKNKNNIKLKGMGDSATWCSSTTSSVVNVMRKFGPSNSKLSRTGCYILHKITSINASYGILSFHLLKSCLLINLGLIGTNGMVEVALASLRHHSSTWDIPFRAGTLLLSITISGIIITTVIILDLYLSRFSISFTLYFIKFPA